MVPSAPTLLLAPESPVPAVSGGQARILHLARRLADALPLEIAALGPVPGAADEPFRLRSAGPARNRWVALATSMRTPYLAARLRSPDLARIVAERRWGSVHACLPYLLPAAVPAGAPVVLDTQNVESQVLALLAASDPNPVARARWQWEAAKTARYEREAVSRATVVCAVTDDEAAVFERWGARQVLVVPNGVDCSAVAHGPPAAGADLLYIGHYGYRPNVLAAVELARHVLPRVRAGAPDARALLVGRDAHLLPPDLGPGVEVIGEVDHVVPFLRAARALVVPLHVGGGSRLKVLEAMAAGAPVISTRVGMAGIDATPDEHVLIGDTAEDMAAQALRVLHDDGLALALSRRARDLVVRRYDWRVVARPLVEAHLRLRRVAA